MPFFDKYPYTNFHNVNLDWVLERVKEWGALVEQNNTAIHDLEEANEDFKNYVTNYIENLDYQVAIDDKLDRMFESGELGEYLQPYVSPTVTTWLDEHITEPTGVVIDTSLTVAGACADAKATGDRIALIPEGMDDETKSALLDCFYHVAWANTEEGLEYYNILEDLFFNSNPIYDIWEWDSTALGINKLYKLSYACTEYQSNSNYGIQYNNTGSADIRRSFGLLSGRYPFIQRSDFLKSQYYPIPVPKTAHKVTATMTPNTTQFAVYLFKYLGNVNMNGFNYAHITPQAISWHTGVDTFEFTPDKNLFVALNVKRDSAGSPFTTETEPNLRIVFE